MWAFVTLGLLWIEQPRLGAPNTLAAHLTKEAESLSGAVLLRQAKYGTTCSIESLTLFDMDLSLCDVSLSTEPLLIFERETDANGVWVRLTLVEQKRVTRKMQLHAPIDAEPKALVSTLMARLFSDYGEVVVSGRTGEELFVDGKWMGAAAQEHTVRLTPGTHTFEMRRHADVVALGQLQVLARNEYTLPLRLDQLALEHLSLRVAR